MRVYSVETKEKRQREETLRVDLRSCTYTKLVFRHFRTILDKYLI